MILLDTNILIEIERDNKKVIEELSKLRKTHPEMIAITSLVYAEFLFGFHKKGKRVPQWIETFEMLDFDKESAAIFAQKKYELEKKGVSIPVIDLITACSAIAHGTTIVTNDEHFERIPELKMVKIEL